MNNVPLIKIEKKTKGKIEQAIVLVSIFCQLLEVKLSKTEKTILAYFIVYKINETTFDLIVKSHIVASPDTLKNVLTKFRKLKLIRKVNKTDVLREELNINLEPVMGIIIKIDNK